MNIEDTLVFFDKPLTSKIGVNVNGVPNLETAIRFTDNLRKTCIGVWRAAYFSHRTDPKPRPEGYRHFRKDAQKPSPVGEKGPSESSGGSGRTPPNKTPLAAFGETGRCTGEVINPSLHPDTRKPRPIRQAGLLRFEGGLPGDLHGLILGAERLSVGGSRPVADNHALPV